MVLPQFARVSPDGRPGYAAPVRGNAHVGSSLPWRDDVEAVTVSGHAGTADLNMEHPRRRRIRSFVALNDGTKRRRAGGPWSSWAMDGGDHVSSVRESSVRSSLIAARRDFSAS